MRSLLVSKKNSLSSLEITTYILLGKASPRSVYTKERYRVKSPKKKTVEEIQQFEKGSTAANKRKSPSWRTL